MDFTVSERVQDLEKRVREFVDEVCVPAEETYERQYREGGDYSYPPIMEDLKRQGRERGLWNMFLPGDRGAGLTNLEYAPLAEIMGRCGIASEAMNCAAPDTGNMEILHHFATDTIKDRYLQPLLDGEIRSAYSMTEPAVASSDANNISTRIDVEGDEFVINGRKWWSTGAMSPRCQVLIVMGLSAPDGERHRRHSMVAVPIDTPGVTRLRSMTVFGYDDGAHGGHAEIQFENVRVPRENLLGELHGGFAIGQARLGPGRIHHTMRAIGMAERAIELMCARAFDRHPFGKPLADQGVFQDWVAEARIKIEMTRLLILKTAWLMDTVGNRGAATEISAIKVAAPEMLTWVVDRAIETFGAAGVSQDTPLARLYAGARTMHIVDGPDEVHKMQLARRELRRYRPATA